MDECDVDVYEQGCTVSRVPTGPGKSRNFEGPFTRPGKSWKTEKVTESPEK